MIILLVIVLEIILCGYKLIFCMIGLDNMQGLVVGKFIVECYKDKIIVVLYDKQQYGEGIVIEVKKIVEDVGIKVVVFEGLNVGDKDFNVLISKLKKVGVQFVYFGGYYLEMGLLLCQVKQVGLDVCFMGLEGVGNSEIIVIVGDVLEGMLVILLCVFEQDLKNKVLIDVFKVKNQDLSGIFVLFVYFVVIVIVKGIEKVGEVDLEKVVEVLCVNIFEIFIGNFGFDEKGDLKNFDFIVYEWYKDVIWIEVK